MSLDSLFNVTIARSTTFPTRVSFGVPLIMAYHTEWAERSKEYYSIDEMITDGFALTDEAVRAATAVFAQNPRPPKIVLGREADRKVMVQVLSPIAGKLKAAGGQDYTVTLNGHAVTYTTDVTPLISEVCSNLKTLLDALTEAVTIVATATTVTITANAVATPFTIFAADPDLIDLENTTTNDAAHGIVEDIMAVRVENDDWYCVILTNNSKAAIEDAALYIETLKKTMIVSCADDEIYDPLVTTDILSLLVTAGYTRTMLMYHHKAGIQYPCAAWVGKGLPQDPGSITWAYKTLAGIDYTYLTPAKRTAIEAKYGNYYTVEAGRNFTFSGIVPANEWFDVIHGLDWAMARMQEAIFGAVMAATKKIPYTDSGAAIIGNAVMGVLKEGSNPNWALFVDDPTIPTPNVIVPLVSTISDVDKAARLLPDVTFTALLAGAIHKVEVSGTVSYS